MDQCAHSAHDPDTGVLPLGDFLLLDAHVGVPGWLVRVSAIGFRVGHAQDFRTAAWFRQCGC
jgi:hypothetical protein